MLEAMRKQSRSVLIYVFFGIIIAVFITTFSPSADGIASCSSATAYVAKVSGRTISESDFRYGFVLMGGAESGSNQEVVARIRTAVLDKLLERELLVLEAERSGLHISDEEIDDSITSGHIVALGSRQDAKAAFFNEGVFDYELFRRFCQYRLGQSVKDFKEQQRKELMAARVADIMRAAVRVSDDEVRSDFEARGRQVDLEFVRFSPAKYASQVQVSDKDVDEFLASNKEKVEERYHTRKFLYTGLPQQVRASHILIGVEKDAAEDVVEQGRVQAEAILAQLKNGADFAALARAESSDENTKQRGGDLGWRARGQSGYGAPFEDAAFQLDPGKFSNPIRSEAGWHVLRVAGRREGDLKLEDVEREIADGLLRERLATDRARIEAEDYLQRLRGGEAWEELFSEKPADETDQKAPPTPSLDKPIRDVTGMFNRRGSAVPKIGVSQELVDDAFDLSLSEPLGRKPYVLDSGGVVLVKLVNRQDPDMAEFEKRKTETIESYRMAKWMTMSTAFSQQRCRRAYESGDLRVSPVALAIGASAAQGTDYVPCATLTLR